MRSISQERIKDLVTPDCKRVGSRIGFKLGQEGNDGV